MRKTTHIYSKKRQREIDEARKLRDEQVQHTLSGALAVPTTTTTATRHRRLPRVLAELIASYTLHPRHTVIITRALDPQGDPNVYKLDWPKINANPGAYELLLTFPAKFNTHLAKTNPAAIDMIAAGVDRLGLGTAVGDVVDHFWIGLHLNPAALDLLSRFPDKIDHSYLLANPSVLEQSLTSYRPGEKYSLDHYRFQLQRNPAAVALLYVAPQSERDAWIERNPHLGQLFAMDHNWCAFLHEKREDVFPFVVKELAGSKFYFCRNPGYVPAMLQDPQLIEWFQLCHNPSVGALTILEANPNQIRWDALSGNHEAGDLLYAQAAWEHNHPLGPREFAYRTGATTITRYSMPARTQLFVDLMV
jgi:hypothetical protein